MSIVILCCRCPGAENLVRNKLTACHHQYAFSAPVHIGKERALQYLDSLPADHQEHPEIKLLRFHLESRHQFAILLGYDPDAPYETCYKWADLNDNSAVSMIDAEVIAEEY